MKRLYQVFFWIVVIIFVCISVVFLTVSLRAEVMPTRSIICVVGSALCYLSVLSFRNTRKISATLLVFAGVAYIFAVFPLNTGYLIAYVFEDDIKIMQPSESFVFSDPTRHFTAKKIKAVPITCEKSDFEIEETSSYYLISQKQEWKLRVEGGDYKDAVLSGKPSQTYSIKEKVIELYENGERDPAVVARKVIGYINSEKKPRHWELEGLEIAINHVES